MSELENLPDLPFLNLLRCLDHKDKLNLRLCNRRLYYFTTTSDSVFKVWTFNPGIMKDPLPVFILESSKDFHIQVKDGMVDVKQGNVVIVKDAKDSMDKLVNFVKQYAQRITSFRIRLSQDLDGPISELMIALKEIKPKWTNLKLFQIKNKFSLVFLDMPCVFHHCQETLEHLDLECVAFTLGEQQVKFPNLTTLKLDGCEGTKSKQLIRSVCTQLQTLHLENYLSDFGLNLDLSEVFRSEEKAFTRLKVLKIYETEVDAVTILNRCHRTITKFHLVQYNEGLDLSSINLNFPVLKSIAYTEYNANKDCGIAHLMSSCLGSLRHVDLEGAQHDLAALKEKELGIQTLSWQMIGGFWMQKEEDFNRFFSFLSGLRNLRKLSLTGYYNQNKEISVHINVPVLTLSKCELGSAVSIIAATRLSLTTLIIHTTVLLHYCLSCKPFVCPNLDTIQIVHEEEGLDLDLSVQDDDDLHDLIQDSDLYLLASTFFYCVKYEIIRESKKSAKIRRVYFLNDDS